MLMLLFFEILTIFAHSARAGSAIDLLVKRESLPDLVGQPTGTVECALGTDKYRWAYATKVGSKELVVIDGVQGKAFDSVSLPCWSRGGRHFAYLAKSTGKTRVILDGVPGPDFDEVISLAPAFDRSGDHLFVIVNKNGRQCVVIDGLVGQPFDKVSYVSFSSDGKRYAYAAELGGTSLMVVDGAPQRAYALVGDPFFSPDCKHVAYAASRHQGFWPVGQMIMVDGKEDPEYDSVTIPYMWTDDAPTYTVVRGAVNFYVVNGIPHAVTGTIVGTPIVRDGHTAYEAISGNKAFAVLDGTSGLPYDSIAFVGLSPDLKHFYYSAKLGDKWRVVLDGLAGPLCDRLQTDGPFYTDDSQHYSYWATDHNKSFVVIDDKPGPEFDAAQGYTRRAYSRDGKHLCYIATKGRREFLVVDGREIDSTDSYIPDWPTFSTFDTFYDLPPFFSPDDKHIIYMVQDGGRTCLCVDGKRGPEEQLLFCSPHLWPDGRLEYLAASGDKGISRVVMKIQDSR
jgi:hypothetical protein